MSFKFFADGSEVPRSSRTLDRVPATVEPESLRSNPSSEAKAETSPAEFDALSLFRPEDPAVRAGSQHAFTRASQPASRPVASQSVVAVGAAPTLDLASLENLRALIRQTEVALVQSTSDAHGLRLEARQLREFGAQLAQEHATLRDAFRQMEERNAIAVEALKAVEHRVGALEARSLAENNRTVGKTEPTSSTKRAPVAVQAPVSTLTRTNVWQRRALEVLDHIKRRSPSSLGILAAVILLLALLAMRSRQQPIQTAERASALQPQTRVSASLSALPGRVPAEPDLQVISQMRPTPSAASPVVLTSQPAQTTPASELRPAADPAPSSGEHSTVAGVDARRSSRTASTKIAKTADSSRPIGSAKETNQQFVGMLQIESVPSGAAVFINQQRVGETPLPMTRLRAGSHVVRIEHDGYERWTTNVTVPADKDTLVRATLQRLRDR
jgi:hypothetical protein